MSAKHPAALQASSTQTTPPPAQHAAPISLQPAAASGAIAVTATLTPWLLSLFLHVGVGLILAFVGLLVIPMATDGPSAIFVNTGPDFSNKAGGVINPGEAGASIENRQSLTRDEAKGSFRHEATISGDVGVAGNATALIGMSGASPTGSGHAQFGLGSAGNGRYGNGAAFAGAKATNAHHVLYVIDRSGSMIMEGAMEKVKSRMRISIGNLKEVQDFHVIFFGKGTTLENPPRRLVPASPEYKKAAAEFLDNVVPTGTTDPIPALARAFEVLNAADAKASDKVIFLLTDGDFKNTGGNQAVVDFIAQRNKDKTVHINTVLYGNAVEGNKSIIDTMKRIADTNGGQFNKMAD